MTKTIEKPKVEVSKEEAGKVLTTAVSSVLAGKTEGIKADKAVKAKKELPKIEHEEGFDEGQIPENLYPILRQTREHSKSVKIYRRRKIWLARLYVENKVTCQDLFGKELIPTPVYFGIGELPIIRQLVEESFPEKVLGKIKFVSPTAPNRTLFSGVTISDKKEEVKK